MSRVTLQDVAEFAGVSKVTVSYVLNGRADGARIRQDTQDKVMEAARTLGYRPNAVARMLATKRSDMVAIVFQYADYFSHWSSFTSDIMHGVCEVAVERGFDLMLHTKRSTLDDEVANLVDGRADGLLLLRDGDDPLVAELAAQKFPAVLFFTRSYLPDVAFVDADNFAGGRMATQHLLELGHTKIAMIRGSLHSIASNDRFNGYRDALESSGLTVNPDYQLVSATPGDNMVQLANLLMSSNRPTAIFSWSDDVAYKAMDVAHGLGLRIPEDLSIVGFDSLEQSNLCSPKLTSVRQPIAEMAREATNLLVAIINNEPVRRRQVIFPLTLDVRASTAPPFHHKTLTI